jgi:hypothetical protein
MRTRSSALGALIAAALIVCAYPGVSALASSPSSITASAFDCRAQQGEKRFPGGAEYKHFYSEEQENGVKLYICSFAGGAPYEIGGEIDTEVFTHEDLTFAGEQAALVVDADTLEVIDLAKGRVTFQHGLVEDRKTEGGHIGRLVLKKDGSAAWTEQLPSGAYEVIEHTTAATRILDDTKTTRPYSLKLKGSTLSWLEHDGESRTAALH